MRDNPKTLRSGLVSLLQIQEGAISLARALKHRQNTKESENWLRWLIFTLPNAQIGLDKYPPAIVEIADRTRESFETQTGTLEWRTGNPLEDCKLWLNGTRSFKEKEIRLPVGTYRAEVTCQNSTGWTRSIAIAPDERTSLLWRRTQSLNFGYWKTACNLSSGHHDEKPFAALQPCSVAISFLPIERELWRDP